MTTYDSHSTDTQDISLHSPQALILTRFDDDGQPLVKRRWADALEKRGMSVIYVGPDANFDEALGNADMVFLTGNDKHHHPDNFNGAHSVTILNEDHYDREFSSATIALARKSYEKKIPTLGVCFGSQAMYLALDGAALHSTEGSEHDHSHGLRAKKNDNGEPDIDHLNKPVVPVSFTADSRYRYRFNMEAIITNSANQYGVREEDLASDENTLVRSLITVDAVSDDGWVKAFHARDGRPYFAVQWHAELEGPGNEVIVDDVVGLAKDYARWRVFHMKAAEKTASPQESAALQAVFA